MPPAPKWTEFPHYPVVAGTAIASIGVTLAWWSGHDISPLFESAMIRRGELWRLVTNVLPHRDVLHLAFNIYWLWVFGANIEKVYGHLKTAALVLLFALGSSALDFTFASGGVGLSGVGYGLFGFLWILSLRDSRFSDAMDQRTVQLFILWFIFCVVTTALNIWPVANLAHLGGLALGVLLAVAITDPKYRKIAGASIGVFILLTLLGATVARPYLNLSATGGYEEGKLGYDALIAGRDQEAARWLRDAAIYQPKLAVYWFDLGIAYQRLGNDAAAHSAYEKAHQLEPNNADFAQAAQE